jgi:XTP/dITP diphosphohydrolase
MNLIFATGNAHKLEEVHAVLPKAFKLISLKDLSFDFDIPETGNTLEDNALIKARFIYNRFGDNVFSEDTGLEIDALHGDPGVLTARYAGDQKNADDNMSKVLHELSDAENRSARFRAVIALIYNQKEYLFEGVLNGHIGLEKKGSEGFGYDPIFIPEGYEKTAAELGPTIKNKISHRVRALSKMLDFLSSLDPIKTD